MSEGKHAKPGESPDMAALKAGAAALPVYDPAKGQMVPRDQVTQPAHLEKPAPVPTERPSA